MAPSSMPFIIPELLLILASYAGNDTVVSLGKVSSVFRHTFHYARHEALSHELLSKLESKERFEHLMHLFHCVSSKSRSSLLLTSWLALERLPAIQRPEACRAWLRIAERDTQESHVLTQICRDTSSLESEQVSNRYLSFFLISIEHSFINSSAKDAIDNAIRNRRNIFLIMRQFGITCKESRAILEDMVIESWVEDAVRAGGSIRKIMLQSGITSDRSQIKSRCLAGDLNTNDPPSLSHSFSPIRRLRMLNAPIEF